MSNVEQVIEMFKEHEPEGPLKEALKEEIKGLWQHRVPWQEALIYALIYRISEYGRSERGTFLRNMFLEKKESQPGNLEQMYRNFLAHADPASIYKELEDQLFSLDQKISELLEKDPHEQNQFIEPLLMDRVDVDLMVFTLQRMNFEKVERLSQTLFESDQRGSHIQGSMPSNPILRQIKKLNLGGWWTGEKTIFPPVPTEVNQVGDDLWLRKEIERHLKSGSFWRTALAVGMWTRFGDLTPEQKRKAFEWAEKTPEKAIEKLSDLCMTEICEIGEEIYACYNLMGAARQREELETILKLFPDRGEIEALRDSLEELDKEGSNSSFKRRKHDEALHRAGLINPQAWWTQND